MFQQNNGSMVKKTVYFLTIDQKQGNFLNHICTRGCAYVHFPLFT